MGFVLSSIQMTINIIYPSTTGSLRPQWVIQHQTTRPSYKPRQGRLGL
ncbi:hypothetical protein PR003_g31425 [Phytophthora rubi]|uniref:Uncharacterized protein n=1 Tax=Phytophthora rubi TaxID=129364 RepID=A0A6A4B927_9STRA|nr:hypothetical protein PF003_g17428 [Phytophthora fragariae]KAE8914863.1 hypothetical protein PF003_g2110 [Phytophthora fragariae]KAE9268505.1 hypothetical protein PR003_g31425 [Phytophthora rubi]